MTLSYIILLQRHYDIVCLLQQRSFQDNQRWAQLLTHIIRAEEVNTSSTMHSPPRHILRWVSV